MEYEKNFDDIYIAADFIDNHLTMGSKIFGKADVIFLKDGKQKRTTLTGEIVKTKADKGDYRCILFNDKFSKEIYEIHGKSCSDLTLEGIEIFMSVPYRAALDKLYISVSNKYVEKKNYSHKKPLDKNLVSVMMPFNADFDNVLDSIKKVCSNIGLSCKRVDDIWINEIIIDDIVELINCSLIVISDFSGKNPNVFYETGIAHTLDKNVIPITQNIDDIPFDLRSYRVLKYLNNNEGLEKLKYSLEKRLTNLKDNNKNHKETNNLLSLNKLIVFSTDSQTSELKVTKDGLDLYLYDIRPNNGGLKWSLSRDQIREILLNDKISVSERSNYKFAGVFSIGYEENWLYSKKLFSTPKELYKNIRRLLELVIESQEIKNQFRLLCTNFYSMPVNVRIETAKLISELTKEMELKDILDFWNSSLPGERVGAAIGIGTHIAISEKNESNEIIISTLHKGLSDRARVKYRIVATIGKSEKLINHFKYELLKISNEDRDSAVKNLAKRILTKHNK